MTMGMLWLLTATLPYKYTHSEQEFDAGRRTSVSKNPLLTSYQFLMKLVSPQIVYFIYDYKY